MNISELIAKLEVIKAQHGDLIVAIDIADTHLNFDNFDVVDGTLLIEGRQVIGRARHLSIPPERP